MSPIDLFCYRGETRSWTFACMIDGDPLNLTGTTIKMTARRNHASPVIFEVMGTIEDAAGGIAKVKLLAAATLALSNQLTTLVYDIFVFAAGGDQRPVASGALEVRPVAASLI